VWEENAFLSVSFMTLEELQALRKTKAFDDLDTTPDPAFAQLLSLFSAQ
jgi:hypothetical protein